MSDLVFKRGTQAKYDAALSNNEINPDDVVFVTDEPKIISNNVIYGIPKWNNDDSKIVKFSIGSIAENPDEGEITLVPTGLSSYDAYIKDVRIGVPEIGTINWNPKGVYSQGVKYYKGDVVSYNNGSYVYIGANTQQDPSQDTDWKLICETHIGHKGDYNYNTTIYNYGDTVIYNRDMYTCIKTYNPSSVSVNQSAPTTGIYWKRIIEHDLQLKEALKFNSAVKVDTSNTKDSQGKGLDPIFHFNDVAIDGNLCYRCTSVELGSDNQNYIYNWEQFAVHDINTDEFKNYKEVTYNELYQLKTNSQLIPGRMYRITDYDVAPQPQTSDWYEITQLSTIYWKPVFNDPLIQEHQFDIIVTALSNNELSHNAKACYHESPSELIQTNIFKDNGCDLSKWELKYDIEPNPNKYNWSVEGSKGIIYYLKDEFNNEASFDFKNIVFKWDVISNPAIISLAPHVTWKQVAEIELYAFTMISNEGAAGMISTFDATIPMIHSGESPYHPTFEVRCQCTNNAIGEYDLRSPEYGHFDILYPDKLLSLTNNVIICEFDNLNIRETSDDTYPVCCNNTIGKQCLSSYICNNSSHNKIGDHCYDITVYPGCFNNTILNGSESVYISNSARNNIVRNNCVNININNETNSIIDGNCKGILCKNGTHNTISNCDNMNLISCRYSNFENCAYCDFGSLRNCQWYLARALEDNRYGFSNLADKFIIGQTMISYNPVNYENLYAPIMGTDVPTIGSDVPSIGSGVL